MLACCPLTRERWTMLRLDADRPAKFCDGLNRRDFLHAGTIAPLGLTLADFFALPAAAPREAARGRDINCIMIVLCGGPSHIDTWDPKPDAPAECTARFRTVATHVPGIRMTDIFPRFARHTDKFSLIRTLFHTATAVHDTGYQLMQTGRLFSGGVEHPHVGCVLGYLRGRRGDLPAHVLLPRPIGRTGGNLPHGHTAGYLGRQYDPFILNADPAVPNFRVPDLLPPGYVPPAGKCTASNSQAVDAAAAAFETSSSGRWTITLVLAYRLMSSPQARAASPSSRSPPQCATATAARMGQSCLLAQRLIERGVRSVTVNMFETVFDEVTWDIHGSRPFTDINQMAREVGATDQGYALLEDLDNRGLLSSTMVTALGEFGANTDQPGRGARDHHPGVWTILIGGGPVRGGRVVGESDELGYVPKVAAGHAGGGGGDDLPRTGHRRPPRVARAAGAADPAGGLRRGANW